MLAYETVRDYRTMTRYEAVIGSEVLTDYEVLTSYVNTIGDKTIRTR